jgi:streptomycin 3"-adenylyltransferase
VTAVAERAFGGRLVAAYLHGSAVLGGYHPARSDVDVLLLVDRDQPRAMLESLAFSLARDRLRGPACGLELDVLTTEAAARPCRPTPFQLVMASGDDDHHATLGVDHGPYEDGVLHLAVARQAGIALLGPAPARMIGPVPRDALLAQLRDELHWASAHASPAYRALNAARAWMFAETGRLASKLDGASWALGRGHDDVLLAARAFQRAETDVQPDAASADALLDAAAAALRSAT